MKASKLRQRITLLQLSSGTSPTGANSKQIYTDVATVWANIEPLSVKDVLNAQAVNSKARFRCTIRYRKNTTSAMRVRYDGKIYQIEGDPLADKDSGHDYLTLILASV